MERHQFITATDKDLNPVFEKMCALSSWELFEIAHQAGEVDELIYNEEEVKKLKDQVEVLRED